MQERDGKMPPSKQSEQKAAVEKLFAAAFGEKQRVR
jgi:hypothetical protein